MTLSVLPSTQTEAIIPIVFTTHKLDFHSVTGENQQQTPYGKQAFQNELQALDVIKSLYSPPKPDFVDITQDHGIKPPLDTSFKGYYHLQYSPIPEEKFEQAVHYSKAQLKHWQSKEVPKRHWWQFTAPKANENRQYLTQKEFVTGSQPLLMQEVTITNDKKLEKQVLDKLGTLFNVIAGKDKQLSLKELTLFNLFRDGLVEFYKSNELDIKSCSPDKITELLKFKDEYGYINPFAALKHPIDVASSNFSIEDTTVGFDNKAMRLDGTITAAEAYTLNTFLGAGNITDLKPAFTHLNQQFKTELTKVLPTPLG